MNNTESQNDWGQIGPLAIIYFNPLLMQDHPELFAQDSVQMANGHPGLYQE